MAKFKTGQLVRCVHRDSGFWGEEDTCVMHELGDLALVTSWHESDTDFFMAVSFRAGREVNTLDRYSWELVE